jgi:hypothetical protein
MPPGVERPAEKRVFGKESPKGDDGNGSSADGNPLALKEKVGPQGLE